jgi:hypothetical protein
MIRQTAGRDIFLACQSDNLIDQGYITEREALTIDGEIDAGIAALAVSYLFTQKTELFDTLIQRIIEIEINPESYKPLRPIDEGPTPPPPSTPTYVYAKLSQTEFLFHLIGFIGVIVFILFTWKIPQKIAARVAAKIPPREAEGFCAACIAFVLGTITVITFLGRIFGFIMGVLSKLWQVLSEMPIEEKILWGIGLIWSIVASLALYIATASGLLWAKLLASLASIVAWVFPFYADLTDADTYVG